MAVKKVGYGKALNPPFDPRMRRRSGLLNLTEKIRRGWIQDIKGKQRVNFLYNPSELGLSHAVDTDHTKNPLMPDPILESTSPWYVTTSSSLGIKLLYDRTYELWGSSKSSNNALARRYGVYADVAAWYYFVKMTKTLTTKASANSMLTRPMTLVPSYIFIGPKLVYYGFVSDLTVTYSHWTQTMVPARCSVDVSFTILPNDARALPSTVDVGAARNDIGGGSVSLPLPRGSGANFGEW